MESNIVDRLVQKFGSQAALGKAAGVSQASVAGWKKAGLVPARRQMALLRSAPRLGIDLSPADFFHPPAEPDRVAS